MHAQRCPVAKLLAASQTTPPFTTNPPACFHSPQSRSPGIKGLLPKRVNNSQRSPQPPRNGDERSFFQNLHGDAAPLLTPCPQMYSDDTWIPPPFPVEPKPFFYPDDAEPPPPPLERYPDFPKVINENCSIHGIHARRGSRGAVIPKSVSCPVAPESRQTANAERLKNWRRSSLTIAGTRSQSSDIIISSREDAPRPPRTLSLHQPLEGRRSRPSPSSSFSSPSTPSPPPPTALSKKRMPEDLQSRKSQFRKAWSFFSIGCDDIPKEKPPPKRILRQPTRHVYRRGISGLPIECTNRVMGVAF